MGLVTGARLYRTLEDFVRTLDFTEGEIGAIGAILSRGLG